MLKRIGKILLYVVLAIVVIGAITYGYFYIKWNNEYKDNMALLGEEAPVITVDGIQFRDLNKNGSLDTYEDSRAELEDRIDDLISQMNIEEKAGMMFIHMLLMNEDGSTNEVPSLTNPFSLMLESTSSQLVAKNMNHFNILQISSAEAALDWNNNLQKMAERTRLGIPVTIATDPRHGKEMNIGTAISTRFFSRWPSQLGLAAIGDSAAVREFAEIARQEYLALGLRLALHPMADLATDPRWARNNGTFGEDAALSARLTEAYILGFQGDSLGANSVACMTKHFPGGGPQEDGWDAHFASGKNQVYPGDNFEYHLIPFTDGAFKAKTAQIMPYYGLPVDITGENVGFAYDKKIITDLLRDSLRYEGVVCTDWALVTDMPVKEASAWGVEHLTELERLEMLINAGNDMIGGESRTDLLLQLVEEGRITEARIDESLRRILRDKFRLGLFEDPYLTKDGLEIFNTTERIEKGEEAQRQSLVLLKNEDNFLPLKGGEKIYAQGMETDVLEADFELVDSPEEADVIFLKTSAPFSPPKGDSFLEQMFRQGRLDFPEEEKSELMALVNTKPTVTILTIDRPPVVPDIDAASHAVIADFEVEDKIIAELILGKFNPTGRLPLEIPGSVESVEQQFEDVPRDAKDKLYPFGHGLTYDLVTEK